MKYSNQLSDVAKNYLSAYYCILDDMIKGMTQAELTSSISANFIVQMIPHHMAAIEMSHNILKYTTNIPLQGIATNIITSQTESIENMRQIQETCSEHKNCDRDVALYQRRVNQILQTMFTAMRDARADNRINCDFMHEMIPHHRGAVEMSKNALGFDICPQLKPILDAIITSQQKGIKEMQQLLRCLGC